MANDMLTGLLNQTGGNNWWGGTAAPTSGYGTMGARPAEAAQVAQSPIGGLDGGGDPDPAQQQQQQTGLEWQQKGMQQNQQKMTNMYAQQVAQLRKYQASFQPGSERWNKYAQQIQQAMAQLNASQAGY